MRQFGLRDFVFESANKMLVDDFQRHRLLFQSSKYTGSFRAYIFCFGKVEKVEMF